MASLERRSGRYRIIFRYAGIKFHHALKTDDSREVESCLARLEENLRLVERGRLEVPPGIDLPVFLLSDGKLNGKPTIEKPPLLGEFFARYHSSLPVGAKEGNTTYTEKIHTNHIERVLGRKVAIGSITARELQHYVTERAKECGRRGRQLSHVTIRKEIGTFASIWNKWGVPQGLVVGPAPTRALIYSKSREKKPFQTWVQIERQIDRGGLDSSEQEELWDSLFLTLPEIQQVLDHVKKVSRFPFLHPTFVFAARTGARRSEILRSRIDDFDWTAKVVRIREKKRDRTKELTFRHVPLSPLLVEVMTQWFADHPGGQFTICKEAGKPLSAQMAAHYFAEALEESKWPKLRGWHVFRHSFASNAALKGVDQRIIDEWMGHQTEEMRRRYRHLFPDQQQSAMNLVFQD